MKLNRLFGAGLILLLATACAPEERGTEPSPAEVPFQAGNLNGATMGRVGSAQTTSGPGVTLTGLVGNFTRLAYQSGGSGSSKAAAYFTAFDTVGGYHVWRVNIDGTGLQQLTTRDSSQDFPSVSPSGKRVVYWQHGFVAGHTTDAFLEDLHADGTTTQLEAEFNQVTVPAWSPDEQWLIYSRNIGGFNREATLRRFNVNTLVREELLSFEEDEYGEVTTATVAGVPTAIFQRNSMFWRMNLNTLDTTFYFASPDPTNGTVFAPRLSPDGSQIVYRLGGQWYLGNVEHPDQATPIYRLQSSQEFPRFDINWLRDGSGFAALLPDDTTSFSQLWTMSLTGQPLSQITTMPFGVERGFSVGPAITVDQSRVLIGDDGQLGSSASGIVFGQGAGGAITAVVAFGSTRPRGIELTAETGLNSSAPVLTYTLRADQLNSLRFVGNPATGPIVSLIDSSTTAAGGALITFDAHTGAVALILPFATANSASDVPVVTDEGGSRVFRGHFLGAWKGGKNVAPAGASSVQLDWRSGVVRSE